MEYRALQRSGLRTELTINEEANDAVVNRSREQDAVESVENAAVSRHDRAGIFDVCDTLQK